MLKVNTKTNRPELIQTIPFSLLFSLEIHNTYDSSVFIFHFHDVFSGRKVS